MFIHPIPHANEKKIRSFIMTIVDTTRTVDSDARIDLSDFIRERARMTRADVGFGWIGTPTAPSTYQQLRGAYERSAATGEPLPISNAFCESSIYLLDDINVQFRFWHDVSHVRLGLSFNLEDELELALWHLAQVREAGYGMGSAVYELLEADLVGQVLLMALIRRFPINQASFVDHCTDQGLMQGLLAEIRRLP